jgi:hypothetical protein
MSYFNHAFKKSFLCKAWIGATTADRNKFTTNLSGAAAAFANSGDFGMFSWKDFVTAASNNVYANQVLCASTSSGPEPDNEIIDLTTNQGFYFAQKSFRATDSIGSNPGHGGYSESIKSKMILPKYINKMYEAQCVTALANQIKIDTQAGADDKSCFKCAQTGTNNFVRIDVKGSPALRFLNHNAYMVFDTGNSCSSCEANGVYLNPIYAMQQFALGIIDDPIISKFVSVTNLIYNIGAGAVTVAAADIATDATLNGATAAGAATWTASFAASINLAGAYVDTEFGTCSFDTRDNNPNVAAFGEPVEIEWSFQNEDGDQCWCASGDGTIATSTVQAAKRGNGSPYTVLKDLIQTDGYLQNPYNQGNKDSARIREIEGSDQIYAAMDMTDTYKSYNLIHSVPRFNNPTGVFDNDQYHYAIYTECDGGVDLDQMFADLETVSGVDFESAGTY